MLSDTTWLYLDRYGTLLGNVLMTATVVAALVGFIRRDSIRRWWVRNRFPDVGGELAPQAIPFDAIIFLVSKPEVPRWVMQHVKPAHVAFVASAQSLESAHTLETDARRLGLRVHGHTCIDDVDDPASTRLAVMQMIARLRDAGCANIAADVTGGKTPMSLGAFMAAEELGVQTIYVATDFDRSLSHPLMQTARVMRISRPG